jgi:heme-degrading monooxygenase HmoA
METRQGGVLNLAGEPTMILEIAQIEVKPGIEAEFEAGVAKAVPIFKRAKGCSGVELQRSTEKPSRYRLFVRWATLENHTVDFRGSADFQEWRNLVGHCFATPPEVEHTRQVVAGF